MAKKTPAIPANVAIQQRTEIQHSQQEIVDAVKQGQTLAPVPNVYVIECDAIDLPEIYTNRSTYIPKIHDYIVDNIMDAGGSDGHPENWYGDVKTWGDAVKRLREGWPEGVARAKKLADSLEGILPEPESARRRPKWNDDDSGELDRDKLYSSGIDTAFRGTTRVKRRAPRVIRIVANWAMHAGYTADQVAWNGAAITALVDVLERADYSVELSLGLPTQHYANGSHITMPVIRVKTAGDPLSLNAIAAIAGHAGIYRSLGFAAICTSPKQVNSGLGSCLTVAQAWETAVEARVVEPVDGFMELCSSEDTAKQSCMKVLRKLFPDLPMAETLAFKGFKKTHGAKWEAQRDKLIQVYGADWWEDSYGDVSHRQGV